MKIRIYIIILTLLVSFISCKDKNNSNKTKERTQDILSDLKIDHLNIWVKHPKKAKERLNALGFTSLPDSLSAIHVGQGTTGRYFYFLNNYLELIYVYDQQEFETNNLKNKDLDFSVRANFENNGASPFSIALKVKDYAVDKIPFEKIKYHQHWMKDNNYIYSAKNSKTHLKEPSIFVVYPEIESDTFKTLSDLKNIPEDYAFAREFYKHPNGAKKITHITITSTNLDLNTETMKAVSAIKNVSVRNGTEHLMELEFDNKIQEKTLDLRPELPLIIHM